MVIKKVMGYIDTTDPAQTLYTSFKDIMCKVVKIMRISVV